MEEGWAEGRALALCKHNFLSLQACNINKEGGLMLDEKTAAQRAEGSSLRWESRSAGIYCCISVFSLSYTRTFRSCLPLCELHYLLVRHNKIPFVLRWTHSKSSGSYFITAAFSMQN